MVRSCHDAKREAETNGHQRGIWQAASHYRMKTSRRRDWVHTTKRPTTSISLGEGAHVRANVEACERDVSEILSISAENAEAECQVLCVIGR